MTALKKITCTDELARAKRLLRDYGDIITNNCIAMQSALIEAEFGDKKKAMRWISNTLFGPGLIPDFDEALTLSEDNPAQAWFDAKMAEHEALRAAQHTDTEPQPQTGEPDNFCECANCANGYGTCQTAEAQPAMTAAATAVLAERQREISAEGWTPEHDDEHDTAQMADAAACYAANAGEIGIWEDTPPSFWPWASSWWKPSTPRRDLVKAGALILAEIERLDRISAPATIEKEQP
jgi:hypothetical protein